MIHTKEKASCAKHSRGRGATLAPQMPSKNIMTCSYGSQCDLSWNQVKQLNQSCLSMFIARFSFFFHYVLKLLGLNRQSYTPFCISVYNCTLTISLPKFYILGGHFGNQMEQKRLIHLLAGMHQIQTMFIHRFAWGYEDQKIN